MSGWPTSNHERLVVLTIRTSCALLLMALAGAAVLFGVSNLAFGASRDGIVGGKHRKLDTATGCKRALARAR